MCFECEHNSARVSQHRVAGVHSETEISEHKRALCIRIGAREALCADSSRARTVRSAPTAARLPRQPVRSVAVSAVLRSVNSEREHVPHSVHVRARVSGGALRAASPPALQDSARASARTNEPGAHRLRLRVPLCDGRARRPHYATARGVRVARSGVGAARVRHGAGLEDTLLPRRRVARRDYLLHGVCSQLQFTRNSVNSIAGCVNRALK